MKKKTIVIPILALTLLLGVAAGLATADVPADGGSTSTTAASTTDGGATTTAPASTDTSTTATTDTTSTTTPTSTTATTTTTPASTDTSTTTPTTTADTTTADTTTADTTTAADTSTAATTTTTTPTTTSTTPSVGQSTVQSTTVSGTTPTTTQGSTTTVGSAPPPTAPCETIQLTCGNNASTQVAIVSQTCNSASGGAVLAIQVETPNGAPVGNVTINPSTTCLNELAITQVVQQYCVGCTIIVIPPPPPVIPYAVTTTIFVGGDSPPPAPAPTAERVMAYCMPTPVQRPDGTVGTLLYLDEGQPEHDPVYAKAVPATYVPGAGMTCPTGATGPKVPMFTLTVPASLVGQYVRLCLQPANPAAKPVCHDIRIDTGATISVPVTSSVSAKVVKKKLIAALKPKSKKAIAKQSSWFALALAPRKAPRRTAGAVSHTTKTVSKPTKKERRLP